MLLWYKSLGLLVLLFVLVGLVACRPRDETAAPEPEAADEQMPAVEMDQSSAQQALIAAATHTARDVARTARETPTPQSTAVPQTLADLLPHLGEAPELANEVWINSEPLRMTDLRGKVVLVEFWTFG